jgi:DNA primase
VSFDADEAGVQAGERAIELAEANDFGVKVAMFEKFKDPAEAAHADPENLRRVVLEAKPAMEFYFEKYLPKEGFKMGDREHLRSLRAILIRIRNISSPVEQSHWLKELARRTGVEEKALSEESARLTETRGPVREEKVEVVSASEEPRSRRELISQKLLSMALRESGFELVEESIAYLSHPYGEIFTILKLGERKSGNSLFDQILNLVILRSGDSLEESLVNLKEELFKEYLREKREDLIQAVRQAERVGNEAELQTALLELNSLSSVLS